MAATHNENEAGIGLWHPPESAEREATAGYRVAGYAETLGLKTRTADEVIERVKEGLDARAFDCLQEALGVTARELAGVVGIPVRTLARRKKSGRLEKDESDRLLRLARLFALAEDVLGSAEDARTWMKAPRPALGGKAPLAYADTEPGAREVEALLLRIEYGVYS